MKKIIAPVIISVLMIIWFVIYFGFIIMLIESTVLKIIIGTVPVVSTGIMIFVLIERINEIRSGEENDLSKY